MPSIAALLIVAEILLRTSVRAGALLCISTNVMFASMILRAQKTKHKTNIE